MRCYCVWFELNTTDIRVGGAFCFDSLGCVTRHTTVIVDRLGGRYSSGRVVHLRAFSISRNSINCVWRFGAVGYRTENALPTPRRSRGSVMLRRALGSEMEGISSLVDHRCSHIRSIGESTADWKAQPLTTMERGGLACR